MSTVIEMRVRSGIPRHLARGIGTMEAALFFAKKINRNQYDSSLFYMEWRLKYLSSIEDEHTPREPRKSTMTPFDPDAHERFCENARETFYGIRTEVQQEQEIQRQGNLFAALDGLVHGSLQDYQLGDLRHALNAVHRFRTKQKRAA
ncbi:hypothetical protein AB1P65_09445 [Roseibium alexandrii]